MSFPIQIIRIDGGWKATATLIPIFYAFGSSPMDAAESFRSQHESCEWSKIVFSFPYYS
jgi:hypothetical protein